MRDSNQPPLLPLTPQLKAHGGGAGHAAHVTAVVSQQTSPGAQLSALEHANTEPAHAAPGSMQEPAPGLPPLDDEPDSPEPSGAHVERTTGTLPTCAVLTFRHCWPVGQSVFRPPGS